MIRRLHAPGPELVVMGLVAAVCGLGVAALLSASLGAHSSGGPAILKTVTTPSADLGKLREAASAPPARAKVRHHRRVRKPVSRAAAPSAPAANAYAQGATGPGQPTYAQGYQPSSGQPVQQLSQPSNPRPAPAPAHKPAPRPKPKPSSGGSFDDSG